MSDNPVSNVKRVETQNLQVTQQAQVSQAMKESSPVQATDQEKKEVQALTNQEQKAPQVISANRETNLKFQVDSETHQVTVMIMDKESNKVISTIPPDKIKDVPPGDLLHFVA